MAHEFHLPDIGEGLTEAVVVSWYVEVGATVGLDEPLVEVETDKAVVDIPSPFAGVVLHHGAAAGDTIEVDALLVVIGAEGETWDAPTEPSAVAAPVGAPAAPAAPIVGTLTEGSGPQVLPMVRRLAAELGVDVETLTGTGPGGRITEDDVRSAAEDRPARRSPMSPLRKAIAANMARSWAEIPHVTTYGEADAEPLLNRRATLGKPPLEALLIAAVCPLLKEYPAFNAFVDGTTIVERGYYDVGFAVDTPDGLLVAVVRDADTLSIGDLATEITRLATGARERALGPDDLRGQTFTVSNIGAVGGRYGTPLVPYGTSAILSVGRADPRPVVRNGAVVVGRELPLSLSYDHRIVDGATGRSFMARLVASLEAG